MRRKLAFFFNQNHCFVKQMCALFRIALSRQAPRTRVRSFSDVFSFSLVHGVQLLSDPQVALPLQHSCVNAGIVLRQVRRTWGVWALVLGIQARAYQTSGVKIVVHRSHNEYDSMGDADQRTRVAQQRHSSQ